MSDIFLAPPEPLEIIAARGEPWAIEALGNIARAERDALLKSCDWTQVSDAPVDKAAWQAYRQALRDVPDQSGFPTQIVWPEKPE